MNVNSRIARANFTRFASGEIASFTGLREAPIKIRAYVGSGASSIKIINVNNNASYFKGLLDGTYGFVDMGTLTWTKSTSGSFTFFYAAVPGVKRINSSSETINLLTSGNYTPVAQSVWSSNIPCVCKLQGGNNNVLISDHDFDDKTGEQVATALSGLYLIYELETATTPTITEEQFKTLLNVFEVENWYKNIDLDDPHGDYIVVNTETQIIGSNSVFSDRGNVEVYYVNI